MQPIYLDYNATTPIDPLVVEEMLPWLRDHFGNSSSDHPYGRRAHAALERARGQLAALLGCDPSEIVFTGGGTESDNHAIIGTAFANRARGSHLISSRIEHPAVLNSLRWLEGQGFTVTYLPVDRHGLVDPEDVRRAISCDTTLITIMHANNEVGTIQPLAEIGAIAAEEEIPFHSDAAQSVGKVPARVDALKVDLLTVAGHKFYAPKGVGALYIRRGTRIEPYLHGAGHEGGRRAGTENVPYIAALGKAAELAATGLDGERERITSLRDRFHRLLMDAVDGVSLNGHPSARLPNTLNVSFAGVNGGVLLARTPEIAASTGSACHARKSELSGVLQAMETPLAQGLGAVRFSLGRWTTGQQIEYAVERIAARVKELRGNV